MIHIAIYKKAEIIIGRVVENCLLGSFTVQNSTITDSYCLENGKLTVEFISMKLGDKNSTGLGTEASPKVDSYKISGHQIGSLEKVN